MALNVLLESTWKIQTLPRRTAMLSGGAISGTLPWRIRIAKSTASKEPLASA